MKNVKSIIVFDIDGTLRDGEHRLHLLPKTNLDRTDSWEEFNLACGGDMPIQDNIDLLNSMVPGFLSVLLSSCCRAAATSPKTSR